MRDSSVPVAKAALMHYAPEATIIDISHCVLRNDVQQAAYLLLSAYRSFEKGTVHIVPVDVFAGEKPRMLMIKKDGHYFIAPDNGILPLTFGSELEKIRLCFEYSHASSFHEWMANAGGVVAAIGEGWVLPYRQCEANVIPRLQRHKITPYGLECNILYVDQYKNVVLDITMKQFEKIVGSRSFSIRIIRLPDITAISNHYNDVPDGAPLCRFNSSGYLEMPSIMGMHLSPWG